jgi:hypothetical protein
MGLGERRVGWAEGAKVMVRGGERGQERGEERRER